MDVDEMNRAVEKALSKKNQTERRSAKTQHSNRYRYYELVVVQLHRFALLSIRVSHRE
jgi:hypothetical protein